jgi:hypothetical protein
MRHVARDPDSFVVCRLCWKRFRAINCFHLRSIHKFKGDHPVLDYKAEFDLTHSMCRDTRKQMSEAKEDYWDIRGLHLSPDEVLSEIRRLHRAKKSLRGKNVPNPLFARGRRLFGSWKNAIEAAGFNYEQVTGVRRWSREKVIEIIKRLAGLGIPINASTIERQHFALYRAAIRLFPLSWAKALKAAGFNPAEHKKTRNVWDRQSAEDWVKKQAARKKSLLTSNVPRNLRHFVYSHLKKGWPEFVEEVTGQPYAGIKKRRDWTRKKVIAEIRRLKAQGNSLNYKAVVRAAGQGIIKQAKKFFGSWPAACAVVGV